MHAARYYYCTHSICGTPTGQLKGACRHPIRQAAAHRVPSSFVRTTLRTLRYHFGCLTRPPKHVCLPCVPAKVRGEVELAGLPGDAALFNNVARLLCARPCLQRGEVDELEVQLVAALAELHSRDLAAAARVDHLEMVPGGRQAHITLQH